MTTIKKIAACALALFAAYGAWAFDDVYTSAYSWTTTIRKAPTEWGVMEDVPEAFTLTLVDANNHVYAQVTSDQLKSFSNGTVATYENAEVGYKLISSGAGTFSYSKDLELARDPNFATFLRISLTVRFADKDDPWTMYNVTDQDGKVIEENSSGFDTLTMKITTTSGQWQSIEKTTARPGKDDGLLVFQADYFKEDSIVPTPEPTSGVLLLLGVAALAIKRKRA